MPRTRRPHLADVNIGHAAAERGDAGALRRLALAVHDDLVAHPVAEPDDNDDGEQAALSRRARAPGTWCVRCCDSSHGETVLAAAARAGSHECCAFLVDEMGADPWNPLLDNSGKSVVHHAAASGDIETLVYLSDVMTRRDPAPGFKASPYDPSRVLVARDHGGRQPLHLAADRGALRCATWLLGEGCPLEPRDAQARTPLHYAAEAGHVEFVKWLGSEGANMMCLDYVANTPLAIAHRSSRAAVVAYLSSVGCDLNVKNRSLVSKRSGGRVLRHGRAPRALRKTPAATEHLQPREVMVIPGWIMGLTREGRRPARTADAALRAVPPTPAEVKRLYRE